MVEIVWTEPALDDLNAIADYIAIDNPSAARELVQKIFGHVAQLARYPESGSVPQELRNRRYRQIVESSCRIFYRYDGESVFVVCVIRSERKLRWRFLRRSGAI
jgi:plasmid stabilization system protein ParE